MVVLERLWDRDGGSAAAAGGDGDSGDDVVVIVVYDGSANDGDNGVDSGNDGSVAVVVGGG